jgi:hypothetical protein
MEVFLILNEQEQVTLAIASGNLPRDSPVEWLGCTITPMRTNKMGRAKRGPFC